MSYIEIIKIRLAEVINNSGIPKCIIAKQLGVTCSMVSQYCNTKKLPSIDNLIRICKILDVELNYVLGVSDY